MYAVDIRLCTLGCWRTCGYAEQALHLGHTMRDSWKGKLEIEVNESSDCLSKSLVEHSDQLFLSAYRDVSFTFI